MKSTEPFDWDLLMRFGLGVIGLGPTEFWNLTPSEFEAAVKGRLGKLTDASPLSRDRLNALLQRFPDGETKS